MRTIGIEIKGREVRIVVLENNEEGIVDITGSYKPLKLEEDEITENVILFRNTLHATFDSFNPDAIVIRWRNPKPAKGFNDENNFGSSPISFKIEGLIQTYESSKIAIIKPQTVTAFLKRNELPIHAKYGYQTEALKMAYYFIKNNN